MPGQDVLPDQPLLPVLLGQRALVRRHSAASAARPPGRRPRYLGPGAVRRAGRRGAGGRDHRAAADHRGRARHRRGRPGYRGRLPEPASRPGLGQDRAPGRAPARQEGVPVRRRPGPPAARSGRVAGARLCAPAADRRQRGRDPRGGRVRGQPGDAARARARLPGRAPAGHGGRRRQRDTARPRGGRGGEAAGPGVLLAVHHSPGGVPARRAGGPGRAPRLRRVQVRRGHRRGHGARPRPAGLAGGRPGHRRQVLAAAGRPHPVVPARPGCVPADQGQGQRADAGRRGGQGRRGRRRRRRHRGGLQRGGTGRPA